VSGQTTSNGANGGVFSLQHIEIFLLFRALKESEEVKDDFVHIAAHGGKTWGKIIIRVKELRLDLAYLYIMGALKYSSKLRFVRCD